MTFGRVPCASARRPDPHHHFWDTPQRGRYLLPELLADIGGGHNIVSTVFLECRSLVAATRIVNAEALGAETRL